MVILYQTKKERKSPWVQVFGIWYSVFSIKVWQYQQAMAELLNCFIVEE
jgi:hypothetical protein